MPSIPDLWRRASASLCRQRSRSEIEALAVQALCAAVMIGSPLLAGHYIMQEMAFDRQPIRDKVALLLSGDAHVECDGQTVRWVTDSDTGRERTLHRVFDGACEVKRGASVTTVRSDPPLLAAF